MEHDVKVPNAKEAVAMATLDLDVQKEEYMQVHNSERKKNKGNPGESVPAASESLVAAKSAYEKAKQAIEAVKLDAMMEGAKAFKIYRNLLLDEARQPWEKIVQAQQTKCPWEDIYGIIAHVEVQGCCKSGTFHLLQDCTDFRQWKWILNYPFIYFPKITKKSDSLVMFWYYK
jgi:hypothetical protein